VTSSPLTAQTPSVCVNSDVMARACGECGSKAEEEGAARTTTEAKADTSLRSKVAGISDEHAAEDAQRREKSMRRASATSQPRPIDLGSATAGPIGCKSDGMRTVGAKLLVAVLGIGAPLSAASGCGGSNSVAASGDSVACDATSSSGGGAGLSSGSVSSGGSGIDSSLDASGGNDGTTADSGDDAGLEASEELGQPVYGDAGWIYCSVDSDCGNAYLECAPRAPISSVCVIIPIGYARGSRKPN
jgi:hypothetical protein